MNTARTTGYRPVCSCSACSTNYNKILLIIARHSKAGIGTGYRHRYRHGYRHGYRQRYGMKRSALAANFNQLGTASHTDKVYPIDTKVWLIVL